MKKIRINVLARELEVKSHLILELLPELGVSEKLTHSSSIDEDVADKLRVKFGIPPSGNGDKAAEHAVESDQAVAIQEEAAPVVERREPPKPSVEPVAPTEARKEEAVEQPSPEPPPASPAAPVRPPISTQPPSAPVRPT